MRIFAFLISLILPGCVAVPSGITPVKDFEAKRYLGTWYEMARLDHVFERGLVNVYAEYSMMEDGGIKVVNRGYDPIKKEWKKAEGRAYFNSDPSTASLRVSFFRPFYGGYHIIDLDKDYSTALVCGPDRSYLWILSRTKKIDAKTTEKLVNKAKEFGFNTDSLIYVKHGID